MLTTDYSVSQYVSDIRAIVNREIDNTELTELIKPLAKRLAASSEMQKDEYWCLDE